MMRNLILLICSVLIVATWLADAKPQGCPSCGSSHEEVTEKCCNDCDLCRTSFNVERPYHYEEQYKCSRSKDYTYNVKHFKSECQEDRYETLHAGLEKPEDSECPKYYHQHYQVKHQHSPPCPEEVDVLDFEVSVPKHEEKCKKYKLKTKVEHHPRHCVCDKCRYESYETSSHSINCTSAYVDQTNMSRCKPIRRFKRSKLKSAVVRRFQEEFGFDKNPKVMPLSKRNRKRSSPSSDNYLCKEGYVCRCVPESNRESLFGTNNANSAHPIIGTPETVPDEPIVGSAFTSSFDELPVYFGGGQPPSYQKIKEQLDSIPNADGSQSTIDLVKDLASLYYEIYKGTGQRNYSVPIKYGTKTVNVNDQGLRTYDIQPVQGVYEPSALNEFASLTNQMLGRYVDNVGRSQSLRRQGLLGNRLLLPQRRQQQNAFMQLLNSYN